MKMLKNKMVLSSRLLLAVLMSLAVLSCESEFDLGDESVNTNPPKVISISEAVEDVEVTQGVPDQFYIIRGENLSSMVSVQFNGVNAGFNPALLTDEVAFVRIPEETPYIGQSNILRVETLGGVVEIDFPLLEIENFTEETVEGVKVVNLFGGDFTWVEKATFVSGSEELGNLVELEANILSVEQTKVTVEVPAGVQQAFIFLETSKGAIARSESYGFSLSIYIDGLSEGWETGGWGGTQDVASNEVAIGQNSVKSIREAWSGLTFLPTDVDIEFGQYESITLQIYGGTNAASVRLALNDFAAFVELPIVQGEWTKYVIPLSDFYPNGGEPDEIFRIDFQESSNTGQSQYIFYVDEFGFL